MLIGLCAAEARSSPIRDPRASITLAETLQARTRAQAQSRIHRQATMNALLEARWQGYFARSLRLRSVNVRRPPNLFSMLAVAEDGLLPESPLVDYLRWRRSRNPNRFDRFHPKIAPMLTQDMVARLHPATPPLPAVPPSPSNPDPNPTYSITQVPIPEPGTMAIALVLAGSFAWIRRRRERTGDR